MAKWVLIAAFCLLLVGIKPVGRRATFSRIDYALALPGYLFRFPHDHGSHPEYKLEWWYYTGHLHSDNGRRFGYELTFFRTGVDRDSSNASRWKLQNFFIAHFALSDIANGRFYYFEKLNRAGPGIAGSDRGSLNTWNENWSARLQDGKMRLQADAGHIKLGLVMTPEKQPVVHGKNGISQKAEGLGRASHYYSITRLKAEGSLMLEGRNLHVVGQNWMDHEFGTNQLAGTQVGWDWFSIQLDNGEELMLYRLRRRDGAIDPYSSGTEIFPNGKAMHLNADDFVALPQRQWKSPKTGIVYPVSWTISVPSVDARLHLVALLDDQELVTMRSTGIAYWEGAMEVSGAWKGKPVRGKGYVELTGYSEKYRPRV